MGVAELAHSRAIQNHNALTHKKTDTITAYIKSIAFTVVDTYIKSKQSQLLL